MSPGKLLVLLFSLLIIATAVAEVPERQLMAEEFCRSVGKCSSQQECVEMCNEAGYPNRSKLCDLQASRCCCIIKD
ncbi:hypothetical protein V2J09_015995 [Rumex salicifolius]